MKLIPTVLSTILAATVALTADVTAAPPAPHNTGTVDVKTGSTSLKLSETFTFALTGANIRLQKVIPGKINVGKGTVSFPISGGAFDLANIEGEITHSGGISLSSETIKVSVTDFVISTPASTDTTTLPTLSALVVVNGSLQGRVNLLSLDLAAANVTAPYTLPHNGKIVLSEVPLKLTSEGAAALNTAFNTTLFTADTEVGTALVNALTAKGSL